MIHVIVPASPHKRPLSFYLATEEWVAAHMPPGDYMFTWIVEPTVIFGRNQVADLEVDLGYCREQGISVFRRRSGGGCVYADPDNLMISYITPDTDVTRVFGRYLGSMARALCGVGVDITVSGRNDLMLGERKVSGNAFYRMASRSIVHGTLLWQVDNAVMSRAITPSRSKLQSRKVKSVGARVTGLSASLPDMTLSSLASYLVAGMCDTSVTLSPADIEGITALQQRYHDPAWTFGRHTRPRCGDRVKLPTQVIDGVGIFDVTILTDADTIADADITGDFFLLSDLDTTIIDRIRGVRPRRDDLARALDGIDASHTIAGLSTSQLISLLTIPDTNSQNINIKPNTTMKETCLHQRHIDLGAQMSPFGGFDMPIQYKGIIEEHNAVRDHVGVFDVSHMGESLVKGPDAERYVNHIFTNNLTGAPDGKIFYGLMLNAEGGTVDDMLVYKRADNEFLIVYNAANIDKDVAWMDANATGYDVEITNLSDHYGEIAVQGPDAEATLRDVLGIDASDLAFYTFKDMKADGEDIVVSRTGYTGEDGFEIYASHDLTAKFWDKLIEAGVQPCGLGCRDTLRFEAGLPLYGDELGDDISPIEAGLGIFVKFEKPEFIGRGPAEKLKTDGPSRRLVGLEINGNAIARHGYDVLNTEGEVIGQVTTGYHSITIDKNLAFALVKAEYAKLGTELMVKVRRKTFPATVVKKRFYQPRYKK